MKHSSTPVDFYVKRPTMRSVSRDHNHLVSEPVVMGDLHSMFENFLKIYYV